LEFGDQLNAKLDSHSFYRFLGVTKARLKIAQNQMEAARNYLVELQNMALEGGWGYGLIAVRILQTLAADDTISAMEYLASALEMAAPEGYIQIFVEGGRKLIPHLQEAARQGIEPEYVGRILGVLGGTTSGAGDQASLVESLSNRELEVLRLVTAGLTNRQIAEKLVISTGTVKTHVHNICGKLGVRNRTEAATRASELGLV
jgi:LuxR family maltose regulon positive regulatory protein